MKSSWLHKEGHQKLIVFCNGWGMDGTPFQPLKSLAYDVYMLYDYRQYIDPNIGDLKKKYKQIDLVCWSMGVWVGQKIFSGNRELFHKTIAINGTLCPIDDRFGIPEMNLNSTLVDYSEEVRLKFYRRMCRDKTNLKSFLANQPMRSIQDQQSELAFLRDTVDCISAGESIYDEVIVAENDFIVPSRNQFDFWQGHSITRVTGYHFLFNLFQNWDQLLSFSD